MMHHVSDTDVRLVWLICLSVLSLRRPFLFCFFIFYLHSLTVAAMCAQEDAGGSFLGAQIAVRPAQCVWGVPNALLVISWQGSPVAHLWRTCGTRKNTLSSVKCQRLWRSRPITFTGLSPPWRTDSLGILWGIFFRGNSLMTEL